VLCNAKKIVRHGHTLHMCLVIVIFHDISKVIAIISSPFSLIYIWFIVSTAFSVFFSKKNTSTCYLCVVYYVISNGHGSLHLIRTLAGRF